MLKCFGLKGLLVFALLFASQYLIDFTFHLFADNVL